MVDQTSKLKIEITGDAARDIRAINKSLERLDKQGDKASRRVRQLSKNLNAAAKAGRAAGAAFGVFAVSGLGLAIRNSIAQEKAVRGLEAVLRSTGNTVGLTSEEIQGLASDLQTLTGIGDETTLEMQKLLATFTNIRGDAFVRATKAAQDLAVVFDRDLNEVAIQLGKALQDPVKGMTALTRAGITFTEQQREAAKAFQANNDLASAQAIVFREVEKQVKGAAEAYRNTLGGALQAVQGAFGDLFETDTGPLVRALNELELILTDPDVVANAQALAISIVEIFGAVAGNSDKILKVLAAWLAFFAASKVFAQTPTGRLLALLVGGGVYAGTGTGVFGAIGDFLSSAPQDLQEFTRTFENFVKQISNQTFGTDFELSAPIGLRPGSSEAIAAERAQIERETREIAARRDAARERLRRLEEEARRRELLINQGTGGPARVEERIIGTYSRVQGRNLTPQEEYAQKWLESFDTIQQGLEDYQGSWEDVTQEILDIGLDAFRRLEDEIVQFAETGKFEVKDMVNSMLRDILRLTVRQGVTGPLASALGSVVGGIGANLFGAPVTGSPGGSAAVPVSGPTPTGGAPVSEIPLFQQGTPYVPRTGLAMVHQGERITSAAQNRSGEGKTAVIINEAPPGTSVETTRAPDGTELINVVLGAVRQDMREGGAANILQNTFGARRAGVFR